MDCSRPGSSIHGVFQARILEWIAIALSSKSLKLNRIKKKKKRKKKKKKWGQFKRLVRKHQVY